MNQQQYRVELRHIPTRPDWYLDEITKERARLIERLRDVELVLLENGRIKTRAVLSRSEKR